MLTSNDNYNIPNTSYVNKDFQTIYPELLNIIKELTYRWDPTITDESDPLVVLVKLNALIADKCNYNIDKNVLETSPLTVAQVENARPLFEQLGYNMKWYQSAKSEISVRWSGPIIKTTQQTDDGEVVANYKNVYTLPRFTTFTDADNQYVYTLSNDLQVVVDSSISTGEILEGSPVELEINNSKDITFVNLDENNRIYFPDYNVAENGIFINTIGKNDYEQWTKVDNLYVQNLGQKVYKFGIDRRQRYCYIEFPEDISNIMGAGINITYIKTNGYNGNIGANVISKLSSDVIANGVDKDGIDVESYTFQEGSLYIQNLIESYGGADPENITDAYRNYKKIAGTFNTLVSLRDYINYFIRTESVSNCFVCDRTNDIQTAYKIMNYENGIYKKVTQWEEVTENEESSLNKLEPFDLKLYALQWVGEIEDAKSYSSSFQILPYYSQDTSKYPECSKENIIVNSDYGILSQEDTNVDNFGSVKYACHDFISYEPNRPILLKNKYPLDIKIVPQYKLTDVQTKEVKNNITKALVEALNSKKTNFGETPEYDFIYETIQNADSRIKATVLDTLYYYTFVSYYEEYEESSQTKYRLREICISDETPYTEGYYIGGQMYSRNQSGNDYLLKPNIGEYCLDLNTQDIYIAKKGVSSAREYEMYSNKRNPIRYEIYAKAVLNGNTPIYKTDEFFYQPGQQEIALDFSVKSIEPFTNVVIANKNDDIIVGEIPSSGVNSGKFILDGENYLPGSFYAEKKITYNGENCKKIWFDEGSYSINDTITPVGVSNANGQVVSKVRVIIKTPKEYIEQTPISIFITYDSDGVDHVYAYDTNMKSARYLYKTHEITTYVNTQIKRNDSVTFYKPSLIEDTKYSSYVKVVRFYKYETGQTTTLSTQAPDSSDYMTIPKDSDYVIKNNEYVSFLWRNEGDESYKYRTYGHGKIINCSFNFEPHQNVVANSSEPGESSIGLLDDLINGSSDYDKYLPRRQVTYRYRNQDEISGTLTEYISKVLATSDYSMSNGKSIQIKKKNSVTVSDVGDRYYWILNERVKDENDDTYKYILFKPGQTDYILKANEYFLYYNKQMTSLYSVGYGTLIHRENEQGDALPEWSVTALSYGELNNYTLENNDVMFSNVGAVKVTVQENTMHEAGEKANVGISLANTTGDGNDNQVTDNMRYGIFTKDGYIVVRQEPANRKINGGKQITDIESLNNTEAFFAEILKMSSYNNQWVLHFSFTSNEQKFNGIRLDVPSPHAIVVTYLRDDDDIVAYGMDETSLGNNMWNDQNYRSISINGTVDDQGSPENNEVLLEFFRLNSIVYDVVNSVFVDIEDTNVYIDNEKINWFYGEKMELDNGVWVPSIESNAFSQISLSIDTDVISTLTENQTIIVTTNSNDNDVKFPISGNIEPYKTDLDDESFIISNNYQPTCLLSSPPIQTYGASYVDTVSQGVNGDDEYTKIYFYKNALKTVDTSTVSSTSYISGVSEIQIKVQAGGSFDTVSLNTQLPQADGTTKYVFKLAVEGIPQEMQDQEILTQYIEFSSNIYDAQEMSSDVHEQVQIHKNGQYSLVYDSENSSTIQIISSGNYDNNMILTIQFSKMYPVVKPDFMNQDDFNSILNKIAELDHDKQFDYTYEIPENEYIENPLEGKSFMNTAHPYNKYTIGQIYDIDTVVTNKVM